MSTEINQNDTLACTYACLMLNDAGVPVTAENIERACKSAGVEVRNTLPILFARFLEKKPMESLFAAAVASAPAAGAAPAAAAPAAGAAAEKKEDKKAAKQEEEEDDDMGFGLFD